MKKSLILLLCLLMMGVVDADAQKRRTKRVVKTQQTVRKKQKQPVDSAVIFAYWDEHGVVTTGVQLRRKGNEYLLTAITVDVIRISLQEGLDFSKRKTNPLKGYYTTEDEERMTGGSWWNMEMQFPGKEKVSSGGRNSNGPRWVFDVYDYLYNLKVKNKWKTKR